MRNFKIGDVLEQSMAFDQSYFEFLRVPTMSLGIYRLPAGSQDMQEPHKQDEVYYIQQGRAEIEVEGDSLLVGPGNIIFVPAFAKHRFKEISEDLEVLVFFAPAEGE
jgi:mannose-6-phosphate isomerase-like protein (cupin superfamily)